MSRKIQAEWRQHCENLIAERNLKKFVAVTFPKIDKVETTAFVIYRRTIARYGSNEVNEKIAAFIKMIATEMSCETFVQFTGI